MALVQLAPAEMSCAKKLTGKILDLSIIRE